MINASEILKGRVVDLYDGSIELAESIRFNEAKQINIFARKKVAEATSSTIKIHPYEALLEAADCMSSVCMLNDKAIKVLIAMYPSAPKYVLVRLAPHSSWLIGILGLLRRVIFGLVRIEGIISLSGDAGKGHTYWLVLEQSGGAVHRIPVLPKAVGIPNFLNWLNTEKIDYIVLRFFEKLPELHREAGDLDILVVDADKVRIENYLDRHADQAVEDSGDIRIGLHAVSGNPGMIPYYPPPLARQMIDRAINGPASAKIPAPKDALCSLIYHALYHSKKGYASGIPSSLAKHTDRHPENDYLGLIKQKAQSLGLAVGETMEEMDEFLAEEGWRPKLDTLAKIAETNVWVRDHFFAGNNDDTEEMIGLSVFIFRDWVLTDGLIEAMVDYISKQGYKIIRQKTFTPKVKQRAFEDLRGGTWGADESGNTDGWLPAGALIVVDTECAKLPATYAVGFEHFRIRKLKEGLRKRLDARGRSSVHSTDNTRESWEYIEICFPGEMEVIKEEVQEYVKPSLLATWKHILSPRYLKHSLKHSLRGFLIRNFLS